jgi:hypothetical protein
MTYQQITQRLGSGLLGDGVDSVEYLLMNPNQVIQNLTWEIPKGNTIYCIAAGGGSSFLQLYIDDTSAIVDQLLTS